MARLSRSRSWFARILAASICGVSLWAQQPAPFRAGVELVTIDVTVVDKDGRPVKGLKAEDFTVKLNGAVRPVQAMDFLEVGGTSAMEAVAGSVNTPKMAAAPKAGGRLFAFVFDDLSFPPGDGKGMAVAGERILPTLDPADLIGVTTTSGLGPVVQPTADRASVNAAMKKLVGRSDETAAPYYVTSDEALAIVREESLGGAVTSVVVTRECNPGTGPSALPKGPPAKGGDMYVMVCPELVQNAGRRFGRLVVDRTASQMRAYLDVIKALQNAPAPKVMVVVSKGVASSPEHDMTKQLDLISEAAAATGVQMYVLAGVADTVDLMESDERRSKARRTESLFLTRGAQEVASAAGGESFLVVGQADRFMKRILTETSAMYRLGVEPPLPRDAGRSFDAVVSVGTKGLTVRTNRRAVLPGNSPSAPPGTLSIDELIRARLFKGGASTDVAIELAEPPAGTVPAGQVAVMITVPSSVPGPLNVMFGLVDGNGEVAHTGRKNLAHAAAADEPYRFATLLPAAPGHYRLRVVTADARGAIGLVEKDVDVR